MEAWLGLVEKLVNPSSLLSSNSVYQIDSLDSNTRFIVPKEYLVKLHQVSFLLLRKVFIVRTSIISFWL